jgi:hypothetical protein
MTEPLAGFLRFCLKKPETFTLPALVELPKVIQLLDFLIGFDSFGDRFRSTEPIVGRHV